MKSRIQDNSLDDFLQGLEYDIERLKEDLKKYPNILTRNTSKENLILAWDCNAVMNSACDLQEKIKEIVLKKWPKQEPTL